jgi:hypothetical protein
LQAANFWEGKKKTLSVAAVATKKATESYTFVRVAIRKGPTEKRVLNKMIGIRGVDRRIIVE